MSEKNSSSKKQKTNNKKIKGTISKVVKSVNKIEKYSEITVENLSKSSKNTKKVSKNLSKSTKASIKTLPIQLSWARVIIFLVVAILTLGIGFGFKTPIEKLLNPKQNTLEVDETKVIDENGLSVHFIDVGQGDAIAIKFPDNKTMLVDAGTSKSSNDLIHYLKNDFFNNKSLIFDYLLLTHSDADHCGGMVKVCNEFIINRIYRPYMYSKYTKNNQVVFDETNGVSTNKNICDTATYYNTIMAFKSEINANGEKAEIVWTDLDTVNSTYKIEGVNYSIDFYAPTQKYITTSAGTVANDFSPIMVLNYNNKKIMLTGDASTTSENYAMAKVTLPQVDLLKVGHHGSATSSGQEFLNQIKPKYAVISVGANNNYNHPTEEALNRLLGIGALIYRTDINGTIIANITSGLIAELNIFATGKPIGVYIHIEYLISGILILAAIICFSKKKLTANDKH